MTCTQRCWDSLSAAKHCRCSCQSANHGSAARLPGFSTGCSFPVQHRGYLRYCGGEAYETVATFAAGGQSGLLRVRPAAGGEAVYCPDHAAERVRAHNQPIHERLLREHHGGRHLSPTAGCPACYPDGYHHDHCPAYAGPALARGTTK